MNKIITKFKRNVEDYGLFSAISKSFSRIFSLIYERQDYIFYRLKTSPGSAEELNPAGNLRFQEIRWTDTAIIQRIERLCEWLRGQLVTMLQNQSLCFVVLDQGKLIGFNLVSIGKVYIPLIHYSKIFNKESAWSEHIWISRKYRNQQIGTRLRKKVIHELYNRKIRWFYGGCLTCNKGSIRLALRTGFSMIALISFHGFFRNRIKRWSYRRIKKL